MPGPPASILLLGLAAVGLAFASPLPHAASVLLAAVAWDRCIGEPPLAVHPVVVCGNLISAFVRRAPERALASPVVGFVAGISLWLVLVGGALLAAGLLLTVAHATAALAAVDTATLAALDGLSTAVGVPATAGRLLGSLGGLGGWALEVVLVKSTFSLQLLLVVAMQMSTLLERRRLPEARAQLSWLCSRDPSALDATQLAGGTLESLAENLSDGFIAPLFWYAVCGPLGALTYRIANTLDSRVGYHGRFEWLGKFSARVDDAINLLPARITALLLAAAALITPGGDAAGGLRLGWRDCARCESPNAGWPMATMAGALGVMLEKEGHYKLGDAKHALSPRDIAAGHRVAQLAGGLATVLAVAVSAAWR